MRRDLAIVYQQDIDDLRESPSLKLIEILEERGARVDYHDPFIAVVPNTREHAALAGRRSVALTAETIAGYDAVLIATDHDVVDYPALVAAARLVVDTRNVCGRARIESDKVVKT